MFLALAPFMPKPRLVGIFGRNLLDEPEQAPGFDALMEFRDHKPFECVGEGRESRAAMELLSRRGWRVEAVDLEIRLVHDPGDRPEHRVTELVAAQEGLERAVAAVVGELDAAHTNGVASAGTSSGSIVCSFAISAHSAQNWSSSAGVSFPGPNIS